jgi:ceramide glucosyltransferase
MTILALVLAALACTALLIHLVSIALTMCRCRRAQPSIAPPADGPLISIIRPVCGDEHHLDETLRSSFSLDYPYYELLFCAARMDDKAVPTVARLISAHPQVRARLLVGNERISENPKLNNVAKGWRAAAGDWIVMADSNVLMPRDYLQRLTAAWRSDTGVVSSPPVGARPQGPWGEIECAFLNTYQARWQCAADSCGNTFAQGKNLLFHRPSLERWGGMAALASEPAEDAAATKIVRAAGRRIRLTEAPFPQLLGPRTAPEVWKRQVRWARLRRASFPFYYALEIATGGLWPLAAMAVASILGALPLTWVMAFGVVWYGSEFALARVSGWHVTRWTPFACLLRDVMLPALWIAGWAGSDFVWRGNEMRTAESGSAV